MNSLPKTIAKVPCMIRATTRAACATSGIAENLAAWLNSCKFLRTEIVPSYPRPPIFHLAVFLLFVSHEKEH